MSSIEERALHVWCYAGCEWVIARDVTDARQVYVGHLGPPQPDEADPSEWAQWDDERPLSLWTNGAGYVGEPGESGCELESQSCRVWVNRLGRGYVGSTEY